MLIFFVLPTLSQMNLAYFPLAFSPSMPLNNHYFTYLSEPFVPNLFGQRPKLKLLFVFSANCISKRYTF